MFTINGFLPDATCTATEAATPGYDQDTSDCQAADLSAVDGSCTMVNTVVPNVVFRVTKDFTDDNPMEVKVNIDCNGGDPLQSDSMIRDAIGPDGFVDFVLYFDASIDVRSTGEIDGGQVCDDGWCTWLNYEGPATDTQTVLIHTDYLGRWVGLHEKTRHSDFEVDNSCVGGNTGSVRVYPEGFDGQPDIARCTFTNTVYFEGIPTLNQYGLALLALLMLGMGAVGFRRFV